MAVTKTPISSNLLILVANDACTGNISRKYADLKTHATILLSDGEFINVVSERLGHADVDTTLKTYGHVLPKKREDVAERFARLVML